MRERKIAVGLALAAVVLSACGSSANASHLESSRILVTKFNGKLTVTATHQASLVDTSGILQNVNAAYFISKTSVVVSQSEGSQSAIFKSFDEGRSWHQVSDVPGSVMALDFVDPQIGYALSGSSRSHSVLLFATSNGGQTWADVHAAQFEAIGFVSAQVGFALVRDSTSTSGAGGSEIAQTKNGGQTWTSVSPSLGPAIASGSFSFVSPTQGWLLAGASTSAGTQVKYLYETLNAGSTWSLEAKTESSLAGTSLRSGYLPASGYISQVEFVSSSVGFINLSQVGLLESDDGGKTWVHIPLAGLPLESAKGILRFSAWSPTSFSVVTGHPSIWLITSPNRWLRVYPPYRETGIYGGASGLFSLSQSGQLSDVQTSASQQPVSRVPLGTIQLDPFDSGIAAFSSAKIYLTTDGKHWDQVPIPHGWSIAQGRFISADFGLVVANDNGPPGAAVLELTKNGGSNWVLVHTKFHPYAIDPVTATSWWAIGGTDVAYTSNTAKLGSRQMIWNLYFTGDGGKSWDEFIANWHAVGGLDFISASEGYVWVPGMLYQTSDRGSSFVRYMLPSQLGIEGMSSMTFQAGGVGWALGNAGYPIYHTIDNGGHWGPNP